MKPTAERVRELLDYNPLTGVFLWRVSPANNTPAGTIAGADCDGYRLIRVAGGRYKGHQLAWLYMTGEWPSSRIDHIDTNRGNNTWTNLRYATNSQNKANMGRRADNTSGFKGVRWYPTTKKWAAQIGFQGTRKNLGYFATPEQAHAAYCEAASRLFGEFARFE
jgi:HNH endonuclease/AP2 domain-containing protein